MTDKQLAVFLSVNVDILNSIRRQLFDELKEHHGKKNMEGSIGVPILAPLTKYIDSLERQSNDLKKGDK